MLATILFFGLITRTFATYPTNQKFDYVIVGAGPAGLVLANRLSENPKVTVAVIEAGDGQYNNSNVTSVETFGLGLNTSVDWSYRTAPQRYTSDREHILYSGRGLGGTTLINGMTYLRAEKEQIDQWEDFGNAGWNWDALYQYYRSQEHFQPPDADKAANGATYEPDYHGFEGEVAVGWSRFFLKEGAFDIFNETNQNLGITWRKDPNGGRMSGYSTWPFTLNSTTNTRQDAARSFYYPVAEKRPNLKVFLNTTATKIVWNEAGNAGEGISAAGVETLSSTNASETVYSTGEVILSAGSLRSPALLELSGVGNPAVFSPLGIKTILDFPSVGATLQEQPTTLIAYASNSNWTGYASFIDYLTASDIFGDDLESITAEIRANISQYAQRIVDDAPPNETTVEVEERLMKLQTDLVFSKNSTVPLAEVLWFPTGNAIAVNYWTLLPFSRGSVHIDSIDPTQQPNINPNYFQLPIDMLIHAAIAVRVREFFATSPLSSHVTTEVSPGFAMVPAGTGYRDEQWVTYIKAAYGPNYHPVSTTAMRSKKFGGVVDSEGRMYGAKNVRVVDAGILPMQISGHLSASVYAIAGKIADAITGKTKTR